MLLQIYSCLRRKTIHICIGGSDGESICNLKSNPECFDAAECNLMNGVIRKLY